MFAKPSIGGKHAIDVIVHDELDIAPDLQKLVTSARLGQKSWRAGNATAGPTTPIPMQLL